MRAPPGFTLLEVVLSAGLLGLVVTLGYQILVPGMRIWGRDQGRSTIDQTGLALETRMVSELQASSRAGLSAVATPPMVGFPSSDDTLPTENYDTSNAQTTWQNYIVYYLDVPHGNVYRKIWCNHALPQEYPALVPNLPGLSGVSFPTDRVAALTAPQLLSICQTRNGSEHLVASSVTRLQVDAVAGGATSLIVDLSIETPMGSQQAEFQQGFLMRL